MTGMQSVWVWEPAIYLFLGGLAGGTFLVSAIVRLVSKDAYGRLAVFAPWVSFVALSAGLLFLLVDVKKPLLAMMMWQSFSNFGSWMAIGAWLLFAAIVVFFVNALFSTPQIVRIVGEFWKGVDRARGSVVKVTLVLGAALGLCVAVYTGVLLMEAGNIPLWDTPLIPMLFTVSALDAGASAVIAILLLEGVRPSVEGDEGANPPLHVSQHWLQIALMALIVLEAIVLTALLVMHSGGTLNQTLAAETLTSGALSTPFWFFVVVVGLAVPFVLGIVDLAGIVKSESLSRAFHLVAIVCALAGGFTLRFVILTAGVHPVLVSPDPYQAMLNVFNLMA